VNDFVFLFSTIVLFLLPYTYKALVAEMCRIGDVKGVGHFEAKFSGRQANFAALMRERHLCSAGRPSGWAVAHILVELFSLALTVETLQAETCRRERF